MLALFSSSKNPRPARSLRPRAARQARRNRLSQGLQLRGEPLEVRRLLAVDVILEWNDVLLEANARDHALALLSLTRQFVEQRGRVAVGAGRADEDPIHGLDPRVDLHGEGHEALELRLCIPFGEKRAHLRPLGHRDVFVVTGD